MGKAARLAIRSAPVTGVSRGLRPGAAARYRTCVVELFSLAAKGARGQRTGGLIIDHQEF